MQAPQTWSMMTSPFLLSSAAAAFFSFASFASALRCSAALSRSLFQECESLLALLCLLQLLHSLHGTWHT